VRLTVVGAEEIAVLKAWVQDLAALR